MSGLEALHKIASTNLSFSLLSPTVGSTNILIINSPKKKKKKILIINIIFQKL